jgi:hypothetical protein
VALATKGATRGQAAHDTVVTGRRLRWPASIGTEAQGYLPERAAGLTPNLERRNLHSFISTSALVAAAGCVGGCRQPSSNLYFIIATIMIIIIKAI